MTSIELSQGLIKHLNISDYLAAKHGGQKTVFVVTINGIKYALKIIKLADDRFKREVKICEQFADSIGIPAIIKIEKYYNDTIILEEYIEGNDLSDVSHLYIGDLPRVFSLIYSITTIMTPVWESRYVHRDLKPQNIRIKEDGSPVVLDFGIARALDEESLTVTGAQPLSWLFASPEQYFGQKEFISYRTDFFCLGMIAYYLFVGSFPFGDTKSEIEKKFKSGDIMPSTGVIQLDKLMNSVFKINPSERPRKINDFIKLLQI